jgi:hypothetical protein
MAVDLLGSRLMPPDRAFRNRRDTQPKPSSGD